MRKAAEGLALRALAVWKDLGDVHPDHGALADRMRRNECKDAGRYQGKMLRKKGPGHEPERGNVAERAYQQQRAAPQPVNEPQTHKGENQVGRADAYRLQQRRLCSEARQLKDSWREVQYGIDAGKLIEESDKNGQQDRQAQLPIPEIRRCTLSGRGRADRVRFRRNLGLGGLRTNEPQDPQASRVVLASAQQPARAFRKPDTQQGVKERWKRRDAQHPAPRLLADTRQQGVGQIGDQNAEYNVELEHARQAAAVPGWGNLRYVQRCRDSGDANAHSADHAREYEALNIRRQRRPYRADKIEYADEQQGRAAPDSVRGHAPQERSEHGAVKGRGNRHAVEPRTQVPKDLNLLLGTRDHHGVEAEQESGERGGDRPEYDLPVHEPSLATVLGPCATTESSAAPLDASRGRARQVLEISRIDEEGVWRHHAGHGRWRTVISRSIAIR